MDTVIIWLIIGIIWIGTIFLSYWLVKYGVKNDVLWPVILAFFLTYILTIIFYVFLRDKKNRKAKDRERKEDRETRLRLERKQREEAR